jgi:hypothetical protein
MRIGPSRTRIDTVGCFRSRSERVTFLSGKVTKATAPAHRFRQHRVAETSLRFSRQAGRRELLATSLWLAPRLCSGPPTAFKSAVPADLVAHPCAQTPAPCSRLTLRCSTACNGAFAASLSAIHGLGRSKCEQFASRNHARTTRADGAPRTRRADAGSVRRRPMDGPSANPEVRERTCAHGCAEGASAGSPFSW